MSVSQNDQSSTCPSMVTVSIMLTCKLPQEQRAKRHDSHRMGEPSTEERPQVLAGVLRSGMTSRRADTRSGNDSSSISFITTFSGPMVARLMCSLCSHAGGFGPVYCKYKYSR